MAKLGILIIQIIILICVLPVYASDINQDKPIKEPVTSSLPEEAGDYPAIVSDYSSNELAVKAVEKNINLFTEKLREKFSLWLSRSGKYIELMKSILKGENIPEEMAFIPLIESGFNPNACSPARAVGYWQFIASTAKKYGLIINWWMDERKDPVKSTMAAANYFKDLYEMFGSWNLALAAYNAGEAKILKAISRTNTDDYWSLLDTKYIKRETKNYVPKFIAASLIANSPEEFGFEELEYNPPLNYDEVTIDSPVDLEVVADCAETTIGIIKELNPELKRWCTPPDLSEYTLRIPQGMKEVFLQKLSTIPQEDRFSIDIYKVKKRDTFKKISKRTHIPVQVILDLNSIEKIMPLKAGMEIYLPPKGKFVVDRIHKAPIRRASFKHRKKTRIKDKGLVSKGIKKASFKYRKKGSKSRYRKKV
jgi:membrane-bound lytic murein transglycosylase D